MPLRPARPVSSVPVTRRGLIIGAVAAGATAVLSACTGESVSGTLAAADGGARGAASPASTAASSASPSPSWTLSPSPSPTASPAAAAAPTAGPVLASIWAHPDDDLIFGFAAVEPATAAGHEVRTIYVTAGDAGLGTGYASDRELGVMTAYDEMRRRKTKWSRKSVVLPSGAHVSVCRPADDPRIVLHFLGLPDGNLNAAGFPSTGHVSLSKLESGRAPSMAAVTGHYKTTWKALQQAIGELLTMTGATCLVTHVPGSSALSRGDHPDHGVVGALARSAWLSSGRPADAMTFALGYPAGRRAQNVKGRELKHKFDVFARYAAHDAMIHACVTPKGCMTTRDFSRWISRTYSYTEAELFPRPPATRPSAW